MTAQTLFSHRVSIITGHYGTGKTELSVNLALALAAEGKRVMLADLDIVNPYFRSRERRPQLEAAGIQVISSSQACSDADVPALPAELLAILENRDIRGILDIGGDPVGARVLARFQPKIVQEDYQLIFVLNANRPEVREAFQSGAGQDIRESDTLGKQMFYYAQRLSDGSVLRVSKTISSALGSALQILPGMAVIAVLMVGLAWMLSKWQVSKLIEPINKLDLEHPLENDVYEELTPLLESMDKQNKEKEAIANMRKEFSANVSHELKTPLTSISGYAEIMMNGLVRPEDVRGFSERIYNEASRLIVLIEDIIRLSKLDEGGGEVEKEEVDLYALTREVCSRLAHKAEKHSVHVEVSGEPVSIVGIRQVLNEMIYNICENAIKYNKPGGKVDVWVGSTLKGVKVIVTDTGIGIPEDQQERIFERFYRVDKSHSKETGGTGLGLSIVKHGAILHNASIHVDSSLGKGTRMELTF